MPDHKVKHLPQIEYYYDGYIFPFIGDADLKTLVEWRKSKLNSENFSYYNKDARNTYFQHLDCIEQCIKILLSNPTADFALNELAKQQKQKTVEEQKNTEQTQKFLSQLSEQDRKKLFKLVDNYFGRE